MGIDSNAKTTEQHEALNNYVKDHGGHIYTIDNQGRKSDNGVKYDDLYPTSVGFRTLLQSQLTKAGEGLEFSIDRLIIFCESGKPSVELVKKFYPRDCLTKRNPSDHVPMLFKVTIDGKISYDEHILVYNMAGPNTNLAEYYIKDESKSGASNFVAMELNPKKTVREMAQEYNTVVVQRGQRFQGGVPVGTGLGGGARKVRKSIKKRGRRGKKSKRGSRRN
jgi:hypothetical protein